MSSIYMQIAVTIISIVVHLIATRSKERRETILELITIYTIGLAGWFSISNNNFSPSNTGIVVYWDFLLPIILIVLYALYRRERIVNQAGS